MNKKEVLKLVGGFVVNRNVHDVETDLYTRGYMDAVTDILAKIQQIQEDIQDIDISLNRCPACDEGNICGDTGKPCDYCENDGGYEPR